MENGNDDAVGCDADEASDAEAADTEEDVQAKSTANICISNGDEPPPPFYSYWLVHDYSKNTWVCS